MILQAKDKTEKYNVKKVLVMGLARSGVGAANFLCELGAQVWITDQKPDSELTDFIKKLHPSVKVEAGTYPGRLLKEMDLMIISPGISLNNSFVHEALSQGIEVIGELELAYSAADGPFIAITGTNGKTTTTMLTNHLLKKAGYQTLLCGNIGNSVCEEILKYSLSQKPDYIVTEVSSFQLETIKSFRPHIAAILNITPDHLDRHGTMQDYIDAKAKISMNQGEDDFLVLNGRASEMSTIAENTSAQTLFFGNKNQGAGVYVKNDWVEYTFSSWTGKIIPLDEIPLTGEHNRENIMASSAIALISGVSPGAVRDGIKSFTAPQHRLEWVASVNGISFYNDSKATNIDAVVRAVENFSSVILLMGGRDKAGDFSVLKPLVRERVKFLILFGESKSVIAQALGGETQTVLVDNFKEGVLRAYENAQPGETIILSPACSSFDMFRDYNERGEKFKEIVLDIVSKGKKFLKEV